MPRRSGTTLMEVLIAIFVMGIGLMSVMALFPTGALRMAAAIKDDRAGHAAANARAIAIAKNIRFDPALYYQSNLAAPRQCLFDNSQFDMPAASRTFADAAMHAQSYPIFVDPRGAQTYSGNSAKWIAGDTNGIRRTSLSFVTNNVATLKWCTLLDEVVFAENGQSGQQVERGLTVSWAWMLRRPKAGVPSVCEVSVVVYNQRPLVAGMAAKEVAYTAIVDVLQPNSMKLIWGLATPAPRLSAGDWVLDASTRSDVTTGKFNPSNAKFHRVDSIGDELDVAGSKSLEIVLQKPLRLQPNAITATIVVLEGVVEVIECGPGWKAGS